MGGTGPVPVAPGSARRWNGWGDPAVVATLSPHASAVLTELVGPARPARDATLAEIVAAVGASRL